MAYIGYLGQSVTIDHKAPPELVFSVPQGPPSGSKYEVNSWFTLSEYTVYINAKLDNTVKTSQDAITYAMKKGYINSQTAYTWIDFIANPNKYVSSGGGKKDLTKVLLWGGLSVVVLSGIIFFATKKR